jgi:hypothetical protein
LSGIRARNYDIGLHKILVMPKENHPKVVLVFFGGPGRNQTTGDKQFHMISFMLVLV